MLAFTIANARPVLASAACPFVGRPSSSGVRRSRIDAVVLGRHDFHNAYDSRIHESPPMDVQELTPKRLSDPDDFAADDFVTLSRLDDYVHWAADELEQFARHPAFDYEPGRDFHLTRLEDMISEAAEMIFDDRYPNPPVWVLLKAIRDHIERLKRYWDDPDDDGSKVSLHGHGMAIDEARVWARLPWNAQADDMHT